jgi:ferredoxin
MTHVVTEMCIKCKYTDCARVCPVGCFYEGKNMLVIDPEQCIDCGVCAIECPVSAIEEASEINVKWQEINRSMSQKWHNIINKKEPLHDAEKFKNEKNKYEKYFSENVSE